MTISIRGPEDLCGGVQLRTVRPDVRLNYPSTHKDFESCICKIVDAEHEACGRFCLMGQYALPRNVEGSWWQHDVNPGEAYDGRLSENLDCFFNCSLWNIGSKTSQIVAWDWHGSIYYNSHRSVIQKSRSFPVGSGAFELYVKIVSPPGCANDHRQCGWSVASGRISLLLLRSSWSVFLSFSDTTVPIIYMYRNFYCSLWAAPSRISTFGLWNR